MREKGNSRIREASSAWWCLEPIAGPSPGAFLCFLYLLPFLGVFLLNVECTGWCHSVALCGH